jgi:uncharacterized protein HemY
VVKSRHGLVSDRQGKLVERDRQAPGHPYLRGVALRALGELSHTDGHHQDARAAFREALRLFAELDIPAEEAMAMQALAALDDDRGHTMSTV